MLVSNSFCLLRTFPLFLGRMLWTIILICFYFDNIRVAAQINAFAMSLGLSRSRLFVPQIITAFVTCYGITRSSILWIKFSFLSTLIPQFTVCFPKWLSHIFPYLLNPSAIESPQNTNDGFLVLIRCWWCRCSVIHRGFDDLIFGLVYTFCLYLFSCRRWS